MADPVIDEIGWFVYPTGGIDGTGRRINPSYRLDEVGLIVISSATSSFSVSDTSTGTASVSVKVKLTIADTSGPEVDTPALLGRPYIYDTSHGTDQISILGQALSKYIDEIGWIVPAARIVDEKGNRINATKIIDEIGRRLNTTSTSPVITDSSHGTDSVSVFSNSKSAADTSHGMDAVSVQISTQTVYVTVADECMGLAYGCITTKFTEPDTSQGADAISAAKGGTNAPHVADNRPPAQDQVSVVAKVSVADTSHGMDMGAVFQVTVGKHKIQSRTLTGTSQDVEEVESQEGISQ